MAGILDPRSRVLDTIITQEGRRQIANGKLRIEWVSFSDAGTFYEADIASGSTDASLRLSFEACSLPQDHITFEADDSGKLVPFRTANEFGVLNGKLLKSDPDSLKLFDEVLASVDFASQAGSLLDSSFENLQNMRLVGTRNELFDESEFLLSTNNIEFTITDTKPIGRFGSKTAYLESLTMIHEDEKLSHLPNFQYMPPLNKVGEDDKATNPEVKKRYNLGHYAAQSAWTHPLTYEELQKELQMSETLGYSKIINFDSTSTNNNLLAQFFEIKYGEINKLDVIDFGTHFVPADRDYSNKHIFFVGKVIKTDQDINSFIHLFTLVFE